MRLQFFQTLKQIWKSKDVRDKIFFTLCILVIFRLLAAIPVVGVTADAIKQFFTNNNLQEILAASGGVLETASVVAIGLNPYINASVILQLLGSVIPKLAELRKEGTAGRRKISMITRYLTVPLAFLQTFVIYSTLKGFGLVGDLTTIQFVTMAFTFTAGSLLMMWFGELISESGVGGGSSVIIFLGIISSVPSLITQNITYMDTLEKVILAVSYILIIVAVIFITESERQIGVQYSRRVRTGATYESFIPLKLTQFGVMPVIFAQALFTFPQLISQFIISKASSVSEQVLSIATSIDTFMNNTLYKELGLFLLIVAFSFFYVTIVFNTDELAENLQKQGAFIPGIRPGKPTSRYLRIASFKLTAIGAVFLALLSVLPTLMQAAGIISTPVISGTGFLITVGAVLEIKRQVESMIIVRSYDKYL